MMGGRWQATFQPFLRFWNVAVKKIPILMIRMFQPFLRFWLGPQVVAPRLLLPGATVSTLLEILAGILQMMGRKALFIQVVSTLLEILGLVYQVLVGF